MTLFLCTPLMRMAECRYSSLSCYSRYQMGFMVSLKLRPLCTRGKIHWLPLNRSLGWPQGRSRCFRGKKTVLLLLGIEPLFSYLLCKVIIWFFLFWVRVWTSSDQHSVRDAQEQQHAKLTLRISGFSQRCGWEVVQISGTWRHVTGCLGPNVSRRRNGLIC